MEQIGLQEAIQAVRTELSAAMAASTGEDIRFRVKAVHMDFQVTIGRSADVGGKVRFWVVDVGASGKLDSVTAHTVHVELDPVTAGGEEVEVSDREQTKPA